MGEVISFEREPRQSTSHPIVEALDELGLALAEHGHQWTERQRLLYETAIDYIGG